MKRFYSMILIVIASIGCEALVDVELESKYMEVDIIDPIAKITISDTDNAYMVAHFTDFTEKSNVYAIFLDNLPTGTYSDDKYKEDRTQDHYIEGIAYSVSDGSVVTVDGTWPVAWDRETVKEIVSATGPDGIEKRYMAATWELSPPLLIGENNNVEIRYNVWVGENEEYKAVAQTPVGDYKRQITINPDLRIVKVWFHELKEPDGDRSTVGENFERIIVDNSYAREPQWGADSILNDCSIAQGRVNFRWGKSDTIEVDDGKTTLVKEANDEFDGSYWYNITKDLDPDYYHVFWVKDLDGAMGFAIPNVNFAVIEQGHDEGETATILAHEFGHSQGLPHQPDLDCQDVKQEDKNIMCPLDPGPAILSSMCATFSGTGSKTKNFNIWKSGSMPNMTTTPIMAALEIIESEPTLLSLLVPYSACGVDYVENEAEGLAYNSELLITLAAFESDLENQLLQLALVEERLSARQLTLIIEMLHQMNAATAISTIDTAAYSIGARFLSYQVNEYLKELAESKNTLLSVDERIQLLKNDMKTAEQIIVLARLGTGVLATDDIFGLRETAASEIKITIGEL